MDWIMGIQNAIDYIEAHMTEELDYEAIAAESFSSSFHFQRMFSILCGYTLGEYIRNRRLTLAGAELATAKVKVIDIALKYGYDSPESFTKAFRTFHGITPSQARRCGAMLKAFSRLSIKVTLEGGNVMHYKIEQKPAMTLTGYKKRLTGSPMSRDLQDHNFICDTRINQAILTYLAHDVDTYYAVLSNVADDGYDFYIAANIGSEQLSTVEDVMGHEVCERFVQIPIPAGTYLVCETERCQYPTNELDEMYRKAVTQWLPSSGYELMDGPEVEITHWFYREGDTALNHSRYCELWLPIVKKDEKKQA